MAAKKPGPKSAPVKSTGAKAAENKMAPKAGATKNAPKGAKKAKPAPAVKKGPIALRTPATRKPTGPIKSVPIKSAPVTPASTDSTTTNHTSNDESGTYYIVVEHDDLRISTAKPKTGGRVETAATFHEAKDKAMDRLIDLIDRFEHRLWEVKQSLDHETLVDRD